MRFGTVDSLGQVSLTRSNGGTPTLLSTWDGSFSGGNGSFTLAGVAGVAATNQGTAININAGAGNTTGVGGALALTAGAGGATAAGGALTLTSGAGGATSGNAGALSLVGGTPVDGNGATISLTASAGVGTNRSGGAVNLTAGASTGTAVGAAISLTAGAGGATANGGALNLTAGAGGATSGDGGSIVLTVGGQTSGSQGTVVLAAPTGGTAPELRFREDDANGTNYFSLKAAASMAANTPYTWPSAYPAANGYQLTSTTAGVLSWAASSGVNRFDFTLTEAGSDNFAINHNFGLASPFTVSVTLLDGSTQVIPDSVTMTNANTVTLNLASYRAANGGTLPAGFAGTVIG